jgi:uncharacterized protein YdaU (DUF1376 family)
LLKLSKNAIIKIMVEKETDQSEDFALQSPPSEPEPGTYEWYRKRCEENAKLAAKREAIAKAARKKREEIRDVGQKTLDLEPAPSDPPRPLTKEETRREIAKIKAWLASIISEKKE